MRTLLPGRPHENAIDDTHGDGGVCASGAGLGRFSGRPGIAVPKDFDPALAKRVQQILVEITEAQAKTLLPTHYTGFVPATHASYKMIEDAGILVGRIKKRG
jgi:hypothetical protein